MYPREEPGTTPIRCDMSGAPETGEERLAEFGRLFARALIGRERTDDGIRFRLRAEPEIAPWARDLAAREQACCAFFDFHIAVVGDEVHWDARVGDAVHWDARVGDDEVAEAMLDEFFALPESAPGGLALLEQRYADRGIQAASSADGTVTDFFRAGD